MRIPAGGDEQERPPPRAVELFLVELDRLPGDVGEHRQRVAELACVDAGEQFVEGVHDYDGA